MVALRRNAISDLKIVSRETRIPEQQKPPWLFKGVNLNDYIKIIEGESTAGHTVAEFIGTGDFARAFNERRRYEVEEGRGEEPILYDAIYSIIEDPSLPQFVPVFELGPAGVIFEQVVEGGEAKFVTVGSDQHAVEIKHYAAAIEYSKQLVVYNQIWSLGIAEREAGRAYNALLNHVHFSPILNYPYGAANQTAAVNQGATLEERMIRTLEAAINASRTDSTNRRPGPYAILTSPMDAFTWERALSRVPQQGVQLQSSAINQVRAVIAYDGWVGSRGYKPITYDGVPPGTSYLVSLNRRLRDFQSHMKQSLEATMGNPDVSRFILEQTVWDTMFGVFADPVRAVQEITLPSAPSP